MHGLIIFAEPKTSFAPPLLDAVLKELKGRCEIGPVRVCVTSKDESRFVLAGRSLLGYAGKSLFNPRMVGKRKLDLPRMTTVTAVAKKHGAEVIEPPRYDVNDPEFIRALKASYAPKHALSFGCLQIWSPDLLRVFGLAVNFHNGYLPDYRGLWATRWSVYRGEKYSGYAFHVMDENIDSGPIILRGRVPVPAAAGPAAVERRKQTAARNDVGKVLDALISGDFEALTQSEGGSYFSAQAAIELRKIDDPKELTAEELYRRLRCFSPLKIRLEGDYRPVTSLQPAGRKARPLSFVTADGVELYPDRLRFVPTRLYLAARKLKAL